MKYLTCVLLLLIPAGTMGATIDTFEVAVQADDCGTTGDAATFSISTTYHQIGKRADNTNKGGWRFPNVTIAKGQTITACTLLIYQDYWNVSVGDPPTITFKGEDVDSAVVFSDESNFDGRVRTTASVNIVMDTVGTGGAGAWKKYGGLQSVFSEVNARDGWGSGNAFVLFHEWNSGGGSDRVHSLSYDHDPSYPAEIIIVHETPSGGTKLMLKK